MGNNLGYIKLVFDSAKLFRVAKDEKIGSLSPKAGLLKSQESIDGKSLTKRKRFGFVNPITYYQISNVLCALTGNRPVNSVRFTRFSHNNDYIDWAKQCYLKYTNLLTYDEDGLILPTRSVITTSKAMDNSNVTQVLLTWSDIKYFVGEYIKDTLSMAAFDQLLSHYNVNMDEATFEDFLEKVAKSGDTKTLYTWLYGLNKKGTPSKTLVNDITYYYISKGHIDKSLPGFNIKGHVFGNFTIPMTQNMPSSGNMRATDDWRIGARIKSGINHHELFCGEILVPIRKVEDLQKFLVGSGVCTILDGGVVTIHGEANPEIDHLSEFELVGNISDQRLTN
jgi:hypothetical protein